MASDDYTFLGRAREAFTKIQEFIDTNTGIADRGLCTTLEGFLTDMESLRIELRELEQSQLEFRGMLNAGSAMIVNVCGKSEDLAHRVRSTILRASLASKGTLQIATNDSQLNAPRCKAKEDSPPLSGLPPLDTLALPESPGLKESAMTSILLSNSPADAVRSLPPESVQRSRTHSPFIRKPAPLAPQSIYGDRIEASPILSKLDLTSAFPSMRSSREDQSARSIKIGTPYKPPRSDFIPSPGPKGLTKLRISHTSDDQADLSSREHLDMPVRNDVVNSVQETSNDQSSNSPKPSASESSLPPIVTERSILSKTPIFIDGWAQTNDDHDSTTQRASLSATCANVGRFPSPLPVDTAGSGNYLLTQPPSINMSREPSSDRARAASRQRQPPDGVATPPPTYSPKRTRATPSVHAHDSPSWIRQTPRFLPTDSLFAMPFGSITNNYSIITKVTQLNGGWMNNGHVSNRDRQHEDKTRPRSPSTSDSELSSNE